MIAKSRTLRMYFTPHGQKSVRSAFDEFLFKTENSKKRHGCYFLYNRKKELLYVGMSVNVAERSVGSMIERSRGNVEVTYIAYYKTKTYSDTPIAESYFISKLKPKLNSTGKYHDELTLELSLKVPKRKHKVFK